MLLVISPSKSLSDVSERSRSNWREPRFLDYSAQLVDRLRELSPAELAVLMGISDPLALLNFQRFEAWQRPFTLENAQPALFLFSGDVYEGLQAATMNEADVTFAQSHLRILSGLYGVLRPTDLMQAYRLEMGTRLSNPRGKDLYAFWGDTLRRSVEEELAAQSCPVLVNLASEEYFKALQPKKLTVPVVQPVFEEWQNGRYRIVSFFAKRARGLMARYAIDQRLDAPEGLRDFDREGYAYAPEVSDEQHWVFRRRRDRL